MSRTLRMNHLDYVISKFLFSNHSVCTFWHNNGLIFACKVEETKNTPSARLLFLCPDQQHSRAIQLRLATEKTRQDIGRHMWQQHVPTRNYSSAWNRSYLLARVTATHAAFCSDTFRRTCASARSTAQRCICGSNTCQQGATLPKGKLAPCSHLSLPHMRHSAQITSAKHADKLRTTIILHPHAVRKDTRRKPPRSTTSHRQRIPLHRNSLGSAEVAF